MKDVLQRGMKQLNIPGEIKAVRPVSGGDINEAFYVLVHDTAFFVKLNRAVTAEFFELEAEGLRTIAASRTIAVPKAYGVVTDSETGIPMLWLEWITGERTEETDALLGEQLARMHQASGDQYGYDGTTYIGTLKQKNDKTNSWLEYYRDYRLAGQLKLGWERNTIYGNRENKLTTLLERLHMWVPENPGVHLLHGDLWGGNWMVGEKGRPYLIDPSILYGDHEFELAFTQLFGGFSDEFYDAYTSVFPLSDTYADREPIYQLYYLLVHLNMFGEGYGSSVDRILAYYVG